MFLSQSLFAGAMAVATGGDNCLLGVDCENEKGISTIALLAFKMGDDVARLLAGSLTLNGAAPWVPNQGQHMGFARGSTTAEHVISTIVNARSYADQVLQLGGYSPTRSAVRSKQEKAFKEQRTAQLKEQKSRTYR